MAAVRVRYIVDDVGAAIAFYGERLSFVTGQDAGGWASRPLFGRVLNVGHLPEAMQAARM